MDDIKITIEAIVALLALLGIGVGTYYTVRKKRLTKTKQKNITIHGDGNKIIGGDDNSANI